MGILGFYLKAVYLELERFFYWLKRACHQGGQRLWGISRLASTDPVPTYLKCFEIKFDIQQLESDSDFELFFSNLKTGCNLPPVSRIVRLHYGICSIIMIV